MDADQGNNEGKRLLEDWEVLDQLPNLLADWRE
jgi:hypothetical protein